MRNSALDSTSLVPDREALTPDQVERVRRVLFLNGLRGDEIDDASQEVRLRAFERGPSDTSSLQAWSCVVATNLALDRHRRARRQEVSEQRLRSMGRRGPEDADVVLRQAMAEALRRLPAELRAVVVLRFYADLTVPDIAARLDVPAGTVKSRLHRALSDLRRSLPQED